MVTFKQNFASFIGLDLLKKFLIFNTEIFRHIRFTDNHADKSNDRPIQGKLQLQPWATAEGLCHLLHTTVT